MLSVRAARTTLATAQGLRHALLRSRFRPARPPSRDPRLRRMEAFFVVVLAVAMLGVGLVALMVLRWMKKKMDPTDFQER